MSIGFLVGNQSTIKDGLLSFETYTASLASRGDAIDKALAKADDAFAGFDSAIARIDNLLPGFTDGKADELFEKMQDDPRICADVRQEVRSRDARKRARRFSMSAKTPTR